MISQELRRIATEIVDMMDTVESVEMENPRIKLDTGSYSVRSVDDIPKLIKEDADIWYTLRVRFKDQGHLTWFFSKEDMRGEVKVTARTAQSVAFFKNMPRDTAFLHKIYPSFPDVR
jgi:D-mannonate dehydratase